MVCSHVVATQFISHAIANYRDNFAYFWECMSQRNVGSETNCLVDLNWVSTIRKQTKTSMVYLAQTLLNFSNLFSLRFSAFLVNAGNVLFRINNAWKLPPPPEVDTFISCFYR